MAVEMDGRDVEALRELVEIAVLLKETGILDLLRVVAEKGHELLALVGNDVGIARMAGLAYAVQAGLEKPSAEDIRDARRLVEKLVSCSISASARVSREEVKPVGLLGLLGALRDRKVQVALGLLLSLARSLGGCIEGARD